MLWRKIKYGGSGGKLIGRIGGWELSTKSFFEKVTFEQTSERRNAVSGVTCSGKTMQADGRANAKALWKEHA